MAESSNSQSKAENELTMCDVLEEEQELEDDANAVLGGSDDTNCSYDKGYVSRQALYACTTCSENREPAGVCLACSYKCHDGHDIVELYTKREFRCDCGNSKFPGNPCSLKSDKEPINRINKYNQNFKGLYCSCSRPYPDLDDDTPDEMIQCIMCEDWYHGRHIGGPVPDDYFEMICAKCMESHTFLYPYLNKFQYVNVSDTKIDNSILKTEWSDPTIKTEDETSTENLSESKENGVHIKEEINDTPTASTIEDSGVNNVSDKKPDLEKIKEEFTVKLEASDDCSFKILIVKSDGISSGPAFWPENWRKELCRCSSCMSMYRKSDCVYLVNVDDTILAYEERGKSVNETQYDKGMSALGQLDRVKQMEAIRAYTNMKGQLKEYLKEFANNKRTVCESDIKEFFERIGKRQKLNNGVPHFCR